MMMTVSLKLATFFFLVSASPLIGILLSGSSILPYLQFPPMTQVVQPQPLSWSYWGISAFLLGALLAPFVWRFVRHPPVPAPPSTPRPYPRWGWVGLALLLLSWILAWTRFAWFRDFQPHTFTPLWLSYILVINAWTYKRTGRCVLIQQPKLFLALFPSSAAFWWCFEYLNRFVQNWYYVGPLGTDPITYVVSATLPFSTVLPAMLSTFEFLHSFDRLTHPFRHWVTAPLSSGKAAGGGVLILGTLGLIVVGRWPKVAYPLIWVSPLLILTGLQVLFGEESFLGSARRGDWRPLVTGACAGLMCGGFWEMWNYLSLAQWHYLISYLQGFYIFEMPLLGYGGYIPFGLSCLAFIQFLFPRDFHRAVPPFRNGESLAPR